jgi:alcohol dehydrogenase
MDFVTAASLGCRFATSFRALTAQGRVGAGQWVAVHGCGGVGLSAIMIASALGAQVIGVDIHEDRLEFARAVGACATVNASSTSDVAATVVEISHGGAHVSIDALGNPQTCFNSIASLRKRGRHVQVGLMLADHSRPQIPMDQVVAKELEILGSHGMQAHQYDGMLEMILAGKLQPSQLIGKRVSLEESLQEFVHMDRFQGAGITVIDSF